MSTRQDKIREVLVKTLRLNNIDPASIKGDDLIHELGISSVDVLEVLIGIEAEFNITIADEDLNQNLISSIQSLEEYILNHSQNL